MKTEADETHTANGSASTAQRPIGVILDDLYHELVASPAWNAHIEAIFELSGFYQEILQYMRTKGLSTKALENAYLTASTAYEAIEQNPDSRLEDWEKFDEIDQAFMTEMAKTASVIAKKEGMRGDIFYSEERD